MPAAVETECFSTACGWPRGHAPFCQVIQQFRTVFSLAKGGAWFGELTLKTFGTMGLREYGLTPRTELMEIWQKLRGRAAAMLKADDSLAPEPAVAWHVPGLAHPSAPDCFKDAPNSTCRSDPKQFRDIPHATHHDVFLATKHWQYNFAQSIHLINGTYLMTWSAGPIAATENWLSLVIATSADGMEWSEPELLVRNLTSGTDGRVYKQRWSCERIPLLLPADRLLRVCSACVCTDGFENEPMVQVGSRLYAMGSFGNQTAAPPHNPVGAESQVIVRQVTVLPGRALRLGRTFWLSEGIPPGFEQYHDSVVGLGDMDAQTRADMASFLSSAVDAGTVPGCPHAEEPPGTCWEGDGERSLFVAPGKGNREAVLLLRNAGYLFSSTCELPASSLPAAGAAEVGHCRPGSNNWHWALPLPSPVRPGASLAGRPIPCNWSMPAATTVPDAPARTCASSLPSGTVFLLGNPARSSKSRLPLTIAVARDGKTFDQAYAIRRDAPRAVWYTHQPGSPILSNGQRGAMYPSAVWAADLMTVAYSLNKVCVPQISSPAFSKV